MCTKCENKGKTRQIIENNETTNTLIFFILTSIQLYPFTPANSFCKNSNALLEPCEGKLSCTVLRGEGPSNGANLLDTKLVYAIGAVVGLIGGIKVYSKWSSGDPDTSKTAASWFGACIFLIVAATILRSFFL